MGTGKRVYGMNRGTVGFLMNEFRERRPAAAHRGGDRRDHPAARDANRHRETARTATALAINEVSLFRQTYQAAKISITVDGKVRLDELICDGVMVATPAGSTAYNLSAHGPILPLDAPLLALTPVSPFRPRRWRGALLSNRAEVRFDDSGAGQAAGQCGGRPQRDQVSVVSVTVRESPQGDGDAAVRRQPFLERAHPRRAVPLLARRLLDRRPLQH